MSPIPNPAVTVGSVIRVAEPDYCYGLGDLILRVCEVGAIQQRDGEPWLFLHGVQLRSNGAEVGKRFALVRVAALDSRQRFAPPPLDIAS